MRMKTIVIIGPTASGKTGLALDIAASLGGHILSLDSLSIYKEIDIASAKPTRAERGSIPHYGIDVFYPDQYFSAATFATLYSEAAEQCRERNIPLIIVGGSSFYLKALIDGMSQRPELSDRTRAQVDAMLRDLPEAFRFMQQIDPKSMRSIAPNDRYRIGNLLGLYLETESVPSQWFAEHPPEPLLHNFALYEITLPRTELRQRITLRTDMMLQQGLIDEVAYLEQKYGRQPNAMHAIGIAEVLEYLDGNVSKALMREAIITHTAQLAKRQQTFNRTQFSHKLTADRSTLHNAILTSSV